MLKCIARCLPLSGTNTTAADLSMMRAPFLVLINAAHPPRSRPDFSL